MGFVFKTIRKEVGEVVEEVCHHFEAFEDFMTFEKQEKSDSNVRNVTKFVKGEKYRIKGNNISDHDFSIGDIVVAEAHSNGMGIARCVKGDVVWSVHVSEVEKVG